MSKVFFGLLIIALIGTSMTADVPEEDGVLVLGMDNFDGVISANQYVLVEFYAPWCGHCKSLAPEYAQAAVVLKDSIPLAKVDATVHKDLASRFGVSGYPTLKFFVDGVATEYNGGRTKDTIVSWLRKKTSPATVEVTTEQQFLDLKDNQVLAVFFGETADSEAFRVFEQVTKSFDDIVFAHVFDATLAASLNTDSASMVVFRKFDAPRVNYEGDFTVADVKTFLEVKEVPTIMGFDQKAAGKIFGDNNPCLFLLTGDDSASASEALNQASSELSGKILMSSTGVADGLGKRLGDYIGVAVESTPCVRLVNPQKDGAILKYEMEGPITRENLLQFYENYVAGKLSPAFKSEPVPESQDEAVYVLVGKSFNDVVMDSTKDVLVEYYAPWCGHCKSLAPIYEELAQSLKSNPNVLIAKMDATANEAEGVNVQGFPTIKYYSSTDKTPVDYSGDRTLEGFTNFLREKATVAWPEAEAEAEVKEDL